MVFNWLLHVLSRKKMIQLHFLYLAMHFSPAIFFIVESALRHQQSPWITVQIMLGAKHFRTNLQTIRESAAMIELTLKRNAELDVHKKVRFNIMLLKKRISVNLGILNLDIQNESS
jgi:hypothetical protein